MKEQQQYRHKKNIFRYASSKKYLKFFVPNFAFKHDNDDGHGLLQLTMLFFNEE